MAERLVALDVPGGDGFVDAVRRSWDTGDAVFVLDGRYPQAIAERVLRAVAPACLVDSDGVEHPLGGGRPMEPGDALVVATGGSAGAPRGVVLTHEAVAASARLTSSRLGVTGDDRWLACLPLAHIGGLSVVTRALTTGTPLTVHDRFDAAAVMASGATLVSLVTAALARIDPEAFRTIVLGGAAPPSELPPNVVATYGMTETGSGVVYDGVPLDGVEVRIDAPDGSDAGEIMVSSPTLLRCYRDGDDDPDPVVDGWFATDDVGSIDADGRLVVHGRRGDVIVSGGENVWPEPIEAALRTHPLVADAAVIGIPDATWGAIVTAVVVSAGDVAPTIGELREHVRAVLPAHAAPRRLVITPSLPRTSLGKLQRPVLAAQLIG